MSRGPYRLLPAIAMLLSVSAVSASAAPEDAIRAVLLARAEAPAEEVAGPTRGAVPVPAEVFSMTGVDNAPIVRSLPDLNGDGRDEVVVGIDHSQVPNVFVLDGASSGTASVLWSYQTASGVSGGSPYGDQCLVAGSDADGNGFANLLTGTAWGGRTAFSFDGQSGAVNWLFDTYLTVESGWVYSLAELSDTTGDGKREVAFGVGSDSDSVYLVSGASTGPATVLWHYAAADAVTSVRNLGDINGDGADDAVVAVSDLGAAIVALSGGTTNPAGQVLWQTPFSGVTVYAVGVMPDLNADGKNEVLVVLWRSDGSSIRCLNGATGASLWASTQVGDPGIMVDLLEDITGDGKPEVIASSWENAVIVLNGATGAQVWKTPVGTTNGGDVWTARVIGDLNGDGHQDVIAGSFDTHVYAMNGQTGAVLWSFPTGNRVFSVYPLDDLDGDGVPEVGAATQDTTNSTVLHVLSGRFIDPAIFADGFETGDTSAWSTVVP